MPSYDYLCPHCRKTSEVTHSMSATAPTQCPKCGKSGLARQYSPLGLKGDGTSSVKGIASSHGCGCGHGCCGHKN